LEETASKWLEQSNQIVIQLFR